MQTSVMTAVTISSLAFIFYGLSCFFYDKTIMEFKRYGLSHLRKLIGSLEFLGGVGLIVGFYFLPVLLLSSGGLTLLMFFGVLVRFKIKDPLILIIPAFMLFILNLFILLSAMNKI